MLSIDQFIWCIFIFDRLIYELVNWLSILLLCVNRYLSFLGLNYRQVFVDTTFLFVTLESFTLQNHPILLRFLRVGVFDVMR